MSRLIAAVCMVAFGAVLPAGAAGRIEPAEKQRPPAPVPSALCDHLVGVGHVYGKVVTTRCDPADSAASDTTPSVS
jgi:hypothetical protein